MNHNYLIENEFTSRANHGINPELIDLLSISSGFYISGERI